MAKETAKYPVPSKQQLKTAVCAWLYSNGVVMLSHEKQDKDAGTINYYTLWQTDIKLYQDCSLIIREGLIPLLWKGLLRVEVYLNNCSESSKQVGITVHSVWLRFPDFEFRLDLLPELISSQLQIDLTTTQPINYADAMVRGSAKNCRISNVP